MVDYELLCSKKLKPGTVDEQMFLLFDQKVLKNVGVVSRGVENKDKNVFDPLRNHGASTSEIIECCSPILKKCTVEQLFYLRIGRSYNTEK